MTKRHADDWRTLQDESFAEMRRERLKALTPNQGLYIKAVETSTITICSGCAGTGKTFCACGLAAQHLKEKRTEKIILTRPLVTCGSGIGFLPGNLDEKVTPYMRPLLDAFGEFFSESELEKHIQHGTIELWPLELMRGASIKNSFIICDEAQNAEYGQLHMLLTRFGTGTRVVITGDASQSDLKKESAFLEVIRRFKKDCHTDISLVRLYKEDIVRHPLIQWIDTRLAGQSEERNVELGAWYYCFCPMCRKNNWYNDGNGLEVDEVDLVTCWNCNSQIYLPEDEDEVVRLATKEDVVAREASGHVRPE